MLQARAALPSHFYGAVVAMGAAPHWQIQEAVAPQAWQLSVSKADVCTQGCKKHRQVCVVYL